MEKGRSQSSAPIPARPTLKEYYSALERSMLSFPLTLFLAWSKIEQMSTNIRSYVFSAVVEEDHFPDGRPAFHAYAPALRAEGAVTWGYTKEEALNNLQEAMQLVVEDLLAHGEPIPEDRAVSNEPLIAITV